MSSLWHGQDTEVGPWDSGGTILPQVTSEHLLFSCVSLGFTESIMVKACTRDTDGREGSVQLKGGVMSTYSLGSLLVSRHLGTSIRVGWRSHF